MSTDFGFDLRRGEGLEEREDIEGSRDTVGGGSELWHRNAGHAGTVRRVLTVGVARR